MLHTQTLSSKTLELLKSLQSRDYLTGFHLAGGTALALYYGHRKSIALALFTNKGFDTHRVLENLHQHYAFQLYHTAPNTLKGNIQDVNVDLIAHRYPYLENPVEADGVSLASDKDILAMKLNAISVSGERVKDFVDVWFALKKHSLKEMIGFYKQKYGQESAAHVLKSLTFFDDVDLAGWPVLLKEQYLSWDRLKKDIENEVLAYTNVHDKT